MDANTIIQLSNMAVTDFLFVIQTANELAAVQPVLLLPVTA